MGNYEEQLKTPTVIVTDLFGNIIVTSDKGGTVSLVSFKYNYDDEDPDECTIKLQTSDPKSLDRLGVGRSSTLQLTWGYITGPLTYTTIVVVKDFQSKYGNNIIYTELVCTDLVYYAQISRSKDVGMTDVITYLKAQFSVRYNIEIRDSSKLILSIPRNKEETQTERDDSTNPDYIIFPNDDVYSSYPVNKLSEIPILEAIKKPAEVIDGPWGVNTSNEIRSWLEKERGVVSGNRSQMVVTRDIFKECPRGPWFITGHGDTLLIHNRNFIDAPVRVYFYKSEDSKLIDFTAKTKYDEFEKNNISHDFSDPSQAKFYFLNSYIDELFSMATFEKKFNDNKLSEALFKTWLEEWLELMKAYEKWHVTRTLFQIYDYNTGEARNIRIANSPAIWGAAIREEGIKRDVFQQPQPYLRQVKGFDPYEGLVLAGFQYTRPLQFMDDRSNFISNEIKKMEMDKEEASLIVEGDPFLQCNMRIQVENVFEQHSGLYYIKSCSHTITQQGYKTELDCIKLIATTRMRSSDSTGTISITDEDPKVREEDQHAKEQELFGKPIRIEVYDKARPLSSAEASYAAGGFSRPTSNIKTIVDVEEELNKGEFVQIMLQLRNKENAKVLPNVEDH